MSKNIELDKFYTPTETAKRCVDLMLDVVTNRFFVTEYLEPSAGSGNFSNLIDRVLDWTSLNASLVGSKAGSRASQ